MLDLNKKFYENETVLTQERDKLSKERETLNTLVIKLDKEREQLAVDKNRLEVKVKALQGAAVKHKAALSVRGDKEYDAGYQAGIKDYLASTHEAFPNLDWAILGQDAVDAINLIKEEKALVVPEAVITEAPLNKDDEVPVDTAAKEVMEAVEIEAAEACSGGSIAKTRVEITPLAPDATKAPPAGVTPPASPTKQNQ
ncbi:hypothetical protein POM88_022983 [Heracleum sosnowskyi]|uniref:Uncharacterized protein n=1 Tax=Heracleum sosnowskyi TaxID=360622 RepID=A0AAD8MVF0_9APIA|nr:hypothetical protein POM88_022983 [Heracleum sosnowskyi]